MGDRAALCYVLAALLLAGLWSDAAAAQPDTSAVGTAVVDIVVDTTEMAPAASASPSPGTALRRSLLVPGWGQLTNGDYLKVPVVVVGVGGFVALAVVNQRRTVLYRRAAIFADCDGGTVALPPGACDGFEAFEDEWREAGSFSAGANRTLRDQSRRNRDFSVLLGTLAYALQALDAYVSAHLAGFDVSEDLSLRLVPTPAGATAAVQWRF